MIDDTKFILRSGIEIPNIGFGPGIMGYSAKMKKQSSKLAQLTYRAINKVLLRPWQKKKFENSIAEALKNGYRLLDYSNTYGNLSLIAKSIEKSGVPRNDLFITTRISNQAQFSNNVRDEFMFALEDMRLDHVDMLQFHWPVTDKYINTWETMIQLQKDGFVKVLGVANCHRHHIDTLEKATGVLPELNQIEVHPLFTQKPLIEFCKSRKILVEAYTPVARYDDRLVRLPLLKKLEKKYSKDFIQLIIRWHIQNGVIPVTKSLNPVHQKSNIDIYDFKISDEDMDLIDSININSRLRYDPDNCDFTIL